MDWKIPPKASSFFLSILCYVILGALKISTEAIAGGLCVKDTSKGIFFLFIYLSLCNIRGSRRASRSAAEASNPDKVAKFSIWYVLPCRTSPSRMVSQVWHNKIQNLNCTYMEKKKSLLKDFQDQYKNEQAIYFAKCILVHEANAACIAHWALSVPIRWWFKHIHIKLVFGTQQSAGARLFISLNSTKQCTTYY